MPRTTQTAPEQSTGVQFTKDGPVVPVDLLQALEDGKLVIFCGAGVSRCCGLPDFRTLVTDVATRLGRRLERDEDELFNSNAYDAALGLIENRIGKRRVRRAVREILTIAPGAELATHEALLQLATSKQSYLRIVTTNFDCGFSLAPCAVSRIFDYAPYLPRPGSNWNSIVHLHGGLGNEKDADGQSLIITSADFGRAYLTEGWAARFLAELFHRSEAILFLGYSVSDPAIRYIVDAFAADRPNEGAHTATAYILSGSTPDRAKQDARTWRSRGIEPIMYDVRDNHRLLHETIRNCAKRYRMGLFDRTSIILEYSAHSPSATLDSEAVSQVTWALRDVDGHTARAFAKLNPSPPIKWLDVLANDGLLRLTGSSQQVVSAVSWVPAGRTPVSLHPVTEGLCTWLVVNLAEPQLVRWVIQSGSHLHPEFARFVRARLDSGKPLPDGVKPIWRFLSAPCAPVHDRHLNQEVLKDYRVLQTHAWDTLLRDLLRSWLTPTVSFKDPFRSSDSGIDPDQVGSYATIELIPAAGHRSWNIAETILQRADIDTIMFDILGEMTELLYRGFTYLELLGQISTDDDGSFSGWPSIDDHPENHRFRHWTVYVYLLREAWERVGRSDPKRARAEADRWMHLYFPIFRRFVLWSAGKTGGLSAAESVAYLAAQSNIVLWGPDTRRELLQYLRRIAPLLSADNTEELCELILAGPPRARYSAEISPEEFAEIADRAIRLRLLRLQENGATLPVRAQERLDQIRRDHPNWPKATSEREEFAVWSGPVEWVAPYEFAERLDDYLGWTDERVCADLRKTPTEADALKRWRGLLLTDPQRSLRVLEMLGVVGAFDAAVWSLGLEHLSGEQTIASSLRLYAAFLVHLGVAFLSKHLRTLTGIVEKYAREKNRDDDAAFWQLWDLLIGPAEEIPPRDGADTVFTALNSPIGNLTDALLVEMGEHRPSTYDQIPEPLRARLERLLSGVQPAHRDARILLAQAMAWIYRLNPDLIVPAFLARFDWAASVEARDMWRGYLLSPGLTPDLWLALRPLLLRAVPHSADLGNAEEQFYAFLAFILLKPDIPLDAPDARRALQQATPKGRSEVAWYWSQQAASATDYGATLYRARVKFLITNVWPLEQELREENSSSHLARLAVGCGTEFPDAVETVIPLLIPVNDPHDLLFILKDTDHPEKHTEPTLALINAIVGNQIEPWGWPDLRALLTRLTTAQPGLAGDPRFIRLDTLLHRFE
jgi:hypothetical protein